tara:strand:+ start:74 stop:901 length:828 start_codon:yes stop_codon:yes gene_type:complete
MKKIYILLISVITIACNNDKHAEFEKNTETAKAYLKLHETEQAEEMFAYLHEDIQWHMPVYGMDMGGIEEVKSAILGYQTEFDNMKFTADYWLPGVDTETGKPDGSTRVYGTWISTYAKTGKEAKLTSYHSYEFKDGKIISGGDWFDLGGMMNSLMPQSLKKGSLIGLHALDVKLKKGVTSQQFEDYFLNTFIPNYENAYKGASLHLAEGLRGQYEGSLGMIWIFDSNEARNAYFDKNGAPTKLNQEISENLSSVNDGLSELGTWTSKYTDWTIH